MSNKDNGGAAFPSAGVVIDYDKNEHQQGAYEGMSLRDYFAAKAVISDDVSIGSAEEVVGRKMPPFANDPLGNSKFWSDYRARMRYIEADAMLAARSA